MLPVGIFAVSKQVLQGVYIGRYTVIYRLFRGIYKDYRRYIGLHRGNGKENGSYYFGCWGLGFSEAVYLVVFQNLGYHFRTPSNKDYNFLVSILGSPYFGKLPFDYLAYACLTNSQTCLASPSEF